MSVHRRLLPYVFKELPFCFASDYIHLSHHEPCARVPLFCISLASLLPVAPPRMRWNPALISMSKIICDLGPLHLLLSFDYFLLKSVCLGLLATPLFLSIWSYYYFSLCILHISPFSGMPFVNIFSRDLTFVQMFLCPLFDETPFIFIFVSQALKVLPKRKKKQTNKNKFTQRRNNSLFLLVTS